MFFALEPYIEGIGVEAFPVTYVAGNVDIGEKIHLDFYIPVALTVFASTAFYVEAVAASLPSPRLRFGKICEKLADAGENPDIGCGVRTRSPADGALVDIDDLVYVADSLDRVEARLRCRDDLMTLFEMAGIEEVREQGCSSPTRTPQ